MKLLAVETNIRKLKAQFVNETEQEALTVYKHGWQMYFAMLPVCIVYVAAMIGLAGLVSRGIFVDDALFMATGFTFLAALMTMFAFFDWRYDFILFTTDKMVIVDSSLLKQRVEPINLEHLMSVIGSTRWANLFGYGSLRIMMEEAGKPYIDLHYIPDIAETAARITDIITDFQRRKMRVDAPILQQNAQMEEAAKVYSLQQNVKVQQETGLDNPGGSQAPPGQQPQQQPKPLKEQREERAQQQSAAASALSHAPSPVPEQAPAEPQMQELKAEVQELRQVVQELRAQTPPPEAPPLDVTVGAPPPPSEAIPKSA